jgi:transcriptional regulator with XRE-family HTH domain
MKDRLLEFLKIENKSSAQFAEEIGVQPSSISHIISGRNNPSLDFVVKMLNKYPALSTDWLIFGKGKMYKEAELTSLFDEQPSENENHKSDFHENSNKAFVSASNKNVLADPEILKELQTNTKSKHTKRIVFFFEDKTFEEFFTRD